ncbi:MAG: amino acid permease [Mariniblastus sp.]|nr:amino acid permease [Mariniblastus sp.]
MEASDRIDHSLLVVCCLPQRRNLKQVKGRPLKTLERRLGLGAVVAISMSAMLGSGIFVLPGLAAAKTGSMVWLAYLVAGLSVLPAALSKSELATAMPTSGGTYVYLERTFGPLAGTISGIGLWLSLLLKSAFALVGFGAYLSVLVDLPIQPVALTLLFIITLLNIVGVSVISKLQKFVIAGVLLALLVLSLLGLGRMDPSSIQHSFAHGWHGFLAATAFVYVSYAGVTKVAAIAEEVKNPDRNLPLGILISWLTVMCVYVFVVFVLVSNVPTESLTNPDGTGKPDLHPIYTLACILGGKVFGIVAALLAVVTMVSMAVAGLLAASRCPFAMSRDQLLPESISRINSSFMTPIVSILLTSIVMGVSIVFLPVEQIAKLASAFMILAFMFVCGTVIVLREIASEWYQPRFRSPLYPFIQLAGIISGIVLLTAMGLTSLFAIACIMLVGAISYFGYGRRQTSRRGVLAKMGKRHDLISKTAENSIATLDEELPTEAAVVVPLFGSERSPETLVEMGASLAHGRRLEVLHVTAVPEQIYLADALEEDQQSVALSRRIHAMAEAEDVVLEYDKTVTRDVVDTIHQVARRLDCEWVVMEAAGRRRLGISFQNPLGWLQDHLPCNLAVFKDTGVRYIRQILVFAEPGPHDSLVVTTADHLAQIYNAKLNFICFVADGQEPHKTQARADYIDQLRDLCISPTTAIVLNGTNELDAIEQMTGGYDLIVMGAAPNRTLKGRLWGTAKDNLTRRAQCSVLWLKTPFLQSHEAFDIANIAVEKEFNLLNFVDEQCIEVNLEVPKKESLFRKATELLDAHYPDIGPIVINSALWEREQIQNTFVGNGVAMPHATLTQANVADSAIAILTTREPINYGTSAGDKADVFFFTTGSPNNRQIHFSILAELSQLCLNTDFLPRARQAENKKEFIELFRECLKNLRAMR